MVKEKEQVDVLEKTEVQKQWFLVIHNDDENTFEYVIHLLIRVCNLDAIRAEQCTLISHHNGKCDVKKGSLDEMKKLKIALVESGLGATVESV